VDTTDHAAQSRNREPASESERRRQEERRVQAEEGRGQDPNYDPERPQRRDPFEEAARRALEEGSQTSGLPSEAGLSPGAGNTPDSTTRVDSSEVENDIPVHPSLGQPPRRDAPDDDQDAR
jgi:hypothetical protein